MNLDGPIILMFSRGSFCLAERYFGTVSHSEDMDSTPNAMVTGPGSVGSSGGPPSPSPPSRTPNPHSHSPPKSEP